MVGAGKKIGGPAMPGRGGDSFLASYKLHLVIVFVSLLILTAGYLIYSSQQEFLRREAEDEITVVAQMKAAEISRWRSEWLAYADALSANSFYAGWIAQWKTSPTPELEGTMRSRLTSEAKRHSYIDLLLIDTRGEVLNSLNGSARGIDKAVLEQLDIAIREHRSVMTDLYIESNSNKPHIDIIAPFFTAGGNGEEAAGAIVLCIDPAQFLYPLLQSWPVPSRTAEIQLVEKQGDSVVFLNGLRFIPDSALKLRIPLTEKENIAVMAVTGGRDYVEGTDYRGKQIMAAPQQVEGSDWYIIAKIDTSEELADTQWQSGLIIAVFITLLAATLAVIGLFWQRRQRQVYQALYKTEAALRDSNSQYRLLAEHMTDTIRLMDLDLRTTYVSPSVQKLRGYTPLEALEMPMDKQLAPGSHKAATEVFAELLPRIKAEPDYNPVIILELEFYCKDGGTIWMENKFSLIRDASGRAESILAESRDITERRKAEQALIESEARVRAKLDTILSPLGDTSALELADIVDTGAIQALMDDFFKLTNIGIAFIDLRGRVLVATGWQDICTKFHRVHPETCKNCIESDILLSEGIEEGTYKVYKCKNNMWDMATPITAGGRKIGNLFLGQFIFTDESPDYSLFRSQAGQYGFDEKDYIAALERVPRWSRETVDTVMAFYAKFARLVSVLSHGNILLARALAENDRTIADLKDREKELRDSEERFSAAFKINPDPTAVTEIDTGRIIDINPAYEKWTGYARNELIGRSTRELNMWVDPADRERFVSLLKQSGEFEDIQISFRIRNGEVRDTRFSARIIHIGGKQYLFTRAHDVTDLNRMQAAIRESEEKYRLLVENALEAIVIAEHGILKFANHQAVVLSGYSQEEFLEKPIIGFIHPDDRSIVNEHFRQQIKGTGVSNIYVFRFVCKQGDIKWVETSVARITWEGRPATLNFLTDVTDRRRLEEEQQRVAKLESVGLLAGGIAHDFNNILTAILGNISLAKTEAAPGSELQDSLEQAEKASQRAKNLTQQLLTFSRGGTPVKKLSALKELLTDTAGFALRGTNVKCRFSISSGLWPAEIDEGQVSQVIHNLVINAQQAMPDGGIIELSAENMAIDTLQSLGKGLPLKEGDYVRISVADHGSGITAEHVAKIFDPFFTTRQKGSGLGLATSFSIARNHGGHLSVESEPGYGSTFYLYLPASTKTLILEQVVKEAVRPAGRARILVMDDEQEVRSVASRMLKHLGYLDIEFAADGTEAIKLYKGAMEAGRPFAVAILDLTIAGGMGGIETIRQLLKIDPAARAVVSSGYADGSVMAEYRAYGFCGMVAKPYTLEELGKALNAVID